MAIPIRGLKFHRRTAFRGLGAATVALFGSAVTRSMAGAQGSGNLVIFYTPNGFVQEFFGADGGETSFTLRPSLRPLDSVKDRITVLENIHNMTYIDKGSHDAVTRILTCVTGTNSEVAAAASVDHVLAKAVGDDTPLFLNVLPWSDPDFKSTYSKLSWSQPGVAATPESDPRRIFDRIFPKSSGSDPEGIARHNDRERRILDVIRGDLATLRGRLDSTGRNLLEIHEGSLNELEKSLLLADGGGAGACGTDELMNQLNKSLPADGSGSRWGEERKAYMQAHGRLQMDLIANAIACGLKRVATLFMQPSTVKSVSVEGGAGTPGHHKISHWHNEVASGYTTQQMKNEKVAMDTYNAQEYLYLMQKLDSLQVLGDTFVPWVSEIAEHHVQKNYTMVVGGGENQGIRTGRFIKYAKEGSRHPYDDLNNNSFNDLWVTAHRVVGVPTQMSGGKMVFGEAKYCKGKGNVDLMP